MKQATHRGWMSSLVFATTLVLAGAAGASDGVIEINQACAVNTGCGGDDSAGFPVFIGGSGSARSYILTSDLVPDNSGSAMLINGDDVTLDMNGFSIRCSPSSTFGIFYGSPQENLHVSNGKIDGCSSGGIGGGSGDGDGARIEGITVDSCPGGGIDVGSNSIVENSTVINSGNTQVGSSPTFSGIRLGSNSIARNNVVSGATIGINTQAGCLISGNVARNNIDGIDGRSSTIINNTSSENSDDGIVGFDGANVIGNTVRNNGTGLDLSSNSTYRGNAITGSTANTINLGVGENRGGNTCMGVGAIGTECP